LDNVQYFAHEEYNEGISKSEGQGEYTVGQGENFFTIARKLGVSVDALVAVNGQIENPTTIAAGQNLKVPAQQAVVCPPGATRYTVQPGDTMFTIARRFGVSLDALIAANPQISNPNLIFPGQIICIPQQQCPPNTFAYTVRPGDSLFLIAQRFGVSLNALIAANPQITNPNLIFPGQIVCVPSTTPPGPCPPNTFAYTVRPGDSLFLIAQRFGVSLNALIAANPQITNPNLIFPGQIVCVPQS